MPDPLPHPSHEQSEAVVDGPTDSNNKDDDDLRKEFDKSSKIVLGHLSKEGPLSAIVQLKKCLEPFILLMSSIPARRASVGAATKMSMDQCHAGGRRLDSHSAISWSCGCKASLGRPH